MKKIFYILFIFIAIVCKSQAKEEIFTIVEEMPSFPGGKEAIAKYFNENTNNVKPNYSISSLGAWMNVIVDTNGQARDAQVLKSCGDLNYDKKFIELANKMPAFIPGKQNGKKVLVYYAFHAKVEFSRNQYDAYIEEKGNKEKADKFYNDGIKSASENKNDEAVEKFKKCLKISPNDIDALFSIGTIYIKLNQKDNACQSWNKIKALGKSDADELLKKYCN